MKESPFRWPEMAFKQYFRNIRNEFIGSGMFYLFFTACMVYVGIVKGRAFTLERLVLYVAFVATLYVQGVVFGFARLWVLYLAGVLEFNRRYKIARAMLFLDVLGQHFQVTMLIFAVTMGIGL